MQLALECPTSLLDDIQPLADFDWVLAHLVLQDKEYAGYYRESVRLKILDNSTNELLHPCSLDELERAAKEIKADCVVAPDYLGDHFSTEKALDEAIATFGPDRVYPVVQGSELGYALECTKYILKRGFNRLAVPYDILANRNSKPVTMGVNRLRVVESIIRMVPIGFYIHLLGMTTLEELRLHNRGWVKSIDTGVPVMMGLQGLLLGRDSLLDKKEPTLSRMLTSPSACRETYMSRIYYNIAYLRRVLA